MVSFSFLLKSLYPFPFGNETISIFNFFQWIYLYVLFVIQNFMTVLDIKQDMTLLDIKQGVFFVIKHNFFEPPTYFLWCHRCKSLNKFYVLLRVIDVS